MKKDLKILNCLLKIVYCVMLILFSAWLIVLMIYSIRLPNTNNEWSNVALFGFWMISAFASISLTITAVITLYYLKKNNKNNLLYYIVFGVYLASAIACSITILI